MTNSSIYVREAQWQEEQQALKFIRNEVFIVEQKTAPEEEWDDQDQHAWHVMALDGDKPIGTGRLTPQGKIGRMAVLTEYRQQNVGSKILQQLLKIAQQHKLSEIYLHAQTHAIPFYIQAGFVAEGPVFIEAGIDHRLMRLSLSTSSVDVVSLSEAQDWCLQLAKTSRYRLWMYTQGLDALLTNHEPFVESCRHIARGGRKAQIHILLHKPQSAVRSGHRLLHLAARLPTAISIKTPTDSEDCLYPSAFIINDVMGVFFRPDAHRHEGKAHLRDPSRRSELLNYFESVWNRAEPALELRQMTL